MSHEQSMNQLRRDLVVLAEIEKRQTAWRQEARKHAGEELEYQRRIEKNLADITKRLNRLLGEGLPPTSAY